MAFATLGRMAIKGLVGAGIGKLKSRVTSDPDEKEVDWAGMGKKMKGMANFAESVGNVAGGIGGAFRARESLDFQKDMAQKQFIEGKRQFGIEAEQTDRAQGMKGLDYLSKKVDRAGAMAKSGPSFRDAISRAMRG